MSGTNGTERGRWEVAIAALLTERTIQDAAQKAGIGVATLRRWLRQPRFLNLYRRARRDVVEAAIARLQGATAGPVDAPQRNRMCGKPAAEIRAANAILDGAMKGIEYMDLEARLQEVEDLLNAKLGDRSSRRDGPEQWRD